MLRSAREEAATAISVEGNVCGVPESTCLVQPEMEVFLLAMRSDPVTLGRSRSGHLNRQAWLCTTMRWHPRSVS